MLKAKTVIFQTFNIFFLLPNPHENLALILNRPNSQQSLLKEMETYVNGTRVGELCVLGSFYQTDTKVNALTNS